MARPLRITYEGAVYHVTMRGNDRRNIFLTRWDREHFLTKLSESVRIYDVRLYLFCQMTNHVHLGLETPQGNLSRFMHRLQTAYTVYFNRKHRSRFCIGSHESHERARQMYKELIQSHDRKEDISFRRDASYHSIDEVLTAVLDILDVPREAIARRCRNSMSRPVVAYALCHYAGCTQRSAAEAMGLGSGVAVSLQLKKLNEQSESDKELRSIMARLRRRLA